MTLLATEEIYPTQYTLHEGGALYVWNKVWRPTTRFRLLKAKNTDIKAYRYFPIEIGREGILIHCLLFNEVGHRAQSYTARWDIINGWTKPIRTT